MSRITEIMVSKCIQMNADLRVVNVKKYEIKKKS